MSKKLRARFDLLQEHIILLQAMYVGWQDCETGAPEINPKRPYGNSDVAGDVIELLEWETDCCEDDPRDCNEHSGDFDDLRSQALELHSETRTALQIVLATGSFEPGAYVKTEEYDDRSWEAA